MTLSPTSSAVSLPALSRMPVGTIKAEVYSSIWNSLRHVSTINIL
jgi:hypothetical protein